VIRLWSTSRVPVEAVQARTFTPVRWIVGEFVTVRRDLHVTLDSQFFLKLSVVFQHGL